MVNDIIADHVDGKIFDKKRAENIYKKEYQDELINKFIKELKQITIKAPTEQALCRCFC